MARFTAVVIDFAVLFFLIAAFATIANPRTLRDQVILFTIVPALYFVVLETRFGSTVGKRIAKIVVVDKEGRKPSFVSALVRMLARYIEVNPLFLGGVPAGLIANFSKSHRRLGDIMAGTYVIRARDLPLLSEPTGLPTGRLSWRSAGCVSVLDAWEAAHTIYTFTSVPSKRVSENPPKSSLKHFLMLASRAMAMDSPRRMPSRASQRQ